jgi:lysophospholipase L1-like esterase
VYYAWARHDAAYLITPLVKRKKPGTVQYTFRVDDFYDDGRPSASHQRGERGISWYFKLRPGVYTPPEPYTYGSIRINSLGFRGPDFDPENRAHRMRVFCVGESSTFGAESPDDQTWPARLAYHLHQHGRANAEVINSGFISAESQNYLNLVKAELLSYHPSLFVLYSGVNNLNVERNYESKPTTTTWFYDLHAMLKDRWSMFYTLAFDTLYVRAKRSALPKYVYRRGAVEEYVRHLSELISLAQTHGVRVLVVRQLLYAPPDLWMNDTATMDELEAQLNRTPNDRFDVRYADYADLYRMNQLVEAARELYRQRGIPMLDLRPEFARALQGPDQLFFDYVHLTPTGNDLLARLIALEAARLLTTPDQPS